LKIGFNSLTQLRTICQINLACVTRKIWESQQENITKKKYCAVVAKAKLRNMNVPIVSENRCNDDILG
jgi:hypothetical protein